MLSTLAFGTNRASSPSDPSWWEEIWDSQGRSSRAKSGARINSKSALGYSAVWSAVTLIAGDIGKIPLFVYRRTLDGRGKERATNHAAYALLRWQPNPEQDAMNFRENMQQDALLWGNGYAYIERRGDSAPTELRWLDPTRTWPERKGGQLRYIHRTDQGNEVTIDASNVFHLRGLGDGIAGYSVLSYAAETFGLGIAARDYGSTFFGNSSVPPLVLEADQNLADKQREQLRTDWERWSRSKDTHRTAVLPRGVHAKPLALPAKDAQLIEVRGLSIREVANVFRVPPHKIGDTTRTSYNSIEQENLSYLAEGLDRWLVKWEFECRSKLLTEAEKRNDSLFVEFERKALLRTDSKSRAEYNRIALGGAPWETINEVRAVENLDPLDDPKADELLWPVNMTSGMDQPDDAEPAGQPASEQPNDQPDATQQNALRAVLLDAVTRVAKRIEVHATKAARKSGGYCEWVDGFVDEHRAAVAAIVGPAYGGCRIGDDSAKLLERARGLLHAAADATADKLPGAVQAACNDFAAWAKEWASEQTR